MRSTPTMALKTVLVLGALVLAATAGIQAQDWAGRGRIQGKVTNEEGEPIEGATITLTKSGAGPEEQIVTDRKGRWSYLGLTGGEWVVLVEHPDYQGYETVQMVRESGPPPAANTVVLRSIASIVGEETQRRQAALEAALETANSLLAEGRYAEARAEFEASMTELDDAGKPMILIAIARTYYQEENPEQAIATLERALEADPNYTEALRLMGSLLVAEGRTEEAEAYIARLPQGEKIDPNAILNQGIEKYNAGDLEGAMREFETVAANYPELPDAYYYRGLIHLNMGNNDQAIADFNKLLELAPDHANIEDVKGFLEYLQE